MVMDLWGSRPTGKTILRAARLYDGTGGPVRQNVAVITENAKIVAVARSSDVPGGAGGVVDLDLGDATLLPGLIDVHTHLTFGFGTKGRKYEEVMRDDSDDLMLVRSIRNAQTHLAVGVTTLRDCGCRNSVTFSTREAFQKGVFFGPGVLVAGRPITITGGHFFFCNGEVDGPDEARKITRALIKQGADFIKIMASGGGTAITDRRRYSFSVAELAAIAEEAHREGRLVTAHCHSTQAIRNAVAAGIDCIEHASFIDPDNRRSYDEAVANEMARKGVYVSPCISTNYRTYEELKCRESVLSPSEEARMHDQYQTALERIEILRRLWKNGVKIVAGTDSIAVFGDYALGLEMMVWAGMTPSDAIVAGTGEAARAIGILDRTGTVEVGKDADLIACANDPLEDIRALGKPTMVMRGGRFFIRP
jgi:imidazolonepropionase-like amidohydrolase